jgi:hypothetical protein
MTKHPRNLLLAITALGAMALGGSVIAQAATSSSSHPAAHTTARDGDTIQSGDQTAPDPGTRATAAHRSAHRAVHARHATARAGETNGENPENAGETSTETGPSDGPGGHADPTGNVDHQFSGQE